MNSASFGSFVYTLSSRVNPQKSKPSVAEIVTANSLTPSLVLIFLINLIIFSNASSYFFTDQIFVINTTFESFILYAVYGLIGYLIVGIKGKDKKDKFSGFITMTYVNNILVVVLAPAVLWCTNCGIGDFL